MPERLSGSPIPSEKESHSIGWETVALTTAFTVGACGLPSAILLGLPKGLEAGAGFGAATSGILVCIKIEESAIEDARNSRKLKAYAKALAASIVATSGISTFTATAGHLIAGGAPEGAIYGAIFGGTGFIAISSFEFKRISQVLAGQELPADEKYYDPIFDPLLEKFEARLKALAEKPIQLTKEQQYGRDVLEQGIFGDSLAIAWQVGTLGGGFKGARLLEEKFPSLVALVPFSELYGKKEKRFLTKVDDLISQALENTPTNIDVGKKLRMLYAVAVRELIELSQKNQEKYPDLSREMRSLARAIFLRGVKKYESRGIKIDPRWKFDAGNSLFQGKTDPDTTLDQFINEPPTVA